MRSLSILFIFLLSSFAFAQTTRLVPQRIALKNGRSITLSAPTDLEIVASAEGMKRVRFFARAPDGRIFVTDMYNLTDNKRGAIYILDGWDERSGKFARVFTYMTGLHNPNSVQFYREASGQDWIYVAETGRLTRRKFTHGEEKPSDISPQTIATFPDYGLDYKYGGWHLTRTIAFSPAPKLYVSVGSSCNSCVEKEDVRATVLEMNPDGSEKRIFARGLRNAVGLKWIGDALYATNQGSDHLGEARPDETFYSLKNNTDYGWPYCHSASGRIFPDPKIKRRSGCRGAARPTAHFPARSSALGFDFFGADAPGMIKDSFVVALHGSTNKRIGSGYKVVVVRPGRRPLDLIAGFLRNGRVQGRPCDVMRLGPESFLLADDHAGVVYLVRKKR